MIFTSTTVHLPARFGYWWRGPKNITFVNVNLLFSIMYCDLFVCVRIMKCHNQRLLTASFLYFFLTIFHVQCGVQACKCLIISCFEINLSTVQCADSIFHFTVEILYVPQAVSYSSFHAWRTELRWKAFSWPIWVCGLGRLWAAVMAGLAGLCNGPHLFTLGQRAPTADEHSVIRWLAPHHSHSSVLVLDALSQHNMSSTVLCFSVFLLSLLSASVRSSLSVDIHPNST